MLRYLVLSMKARIVGNAATVGLLAIVIACCILIFTFANNLKQLIVGVGDPDNMIVLSKAAQGGENGSTISPDIYRHVQVLPGVVQEGGVALVSPEMVAGTTLRDQNGAPMGEVVIRGVDPVAYRVHRKIHVIKGRLPQPGSEEVAIGKSLDNILPNLTVGGKFNKATIVGVFEAGGSLQESEIWMDRQQLILSLGHVIKDPIKSLHIRIENPSVAPEIVKAVASPQIGAWALTELQFYWLFAGDSKVFANAATFFSLLLALGAAFATANALYSSILGRLSEFATLHAIGVRRGTLGLLVVQESLILSIVGVLVGIAISMLFNGVQIARLWSTDRFEQFPIHVNAESLAMGALVGLVIGALSGLVPAIAVRRMNVLSALR